MYIKQGDIFWGMSKEFVKEAMDATEKLNPNEGTILFQQGDPASHFYILNKGRVKLTIGETGPAVYIARHTGEIIGWSSLIGRDVYTASAECLEESNLVKIESKNFLKILEKDSSNEAILFKRLAEMLGNRLLDISPSIV